MSCGGVRLSSRYECRVPNEMMIAPVIGSVLLRCAKRWCSTAVRASSYYRIHAAAQQGVIVFWLETHAETVKLAVSNAKDGPKWKSKNGSDDDSK
jgi:hypothetical protein